MRLTASSCGVVLMLLTTAQAARPLLGSIEVTLELTGVILVLIALGALEFARRQVNEMQETTRAQTRAMRAAVLLTLDDRWESALHDARRKLIEIFDEAEQSKGPRSVEVTCAEKLAYLRDHDPDTYWTAFRLCGFFETAGYAVRAGYLEAGDIVDVFGGGLLRAGQVFEKHIVGLREGAHDHLLYEHFFSLVMLARDRPERRGSGPGTR